MGNRVKKGLAVFLSLTMLIMCIPAGVFAVEASDNQNVITGASYDDSKVNVKVEGTSINVEVPYSYTDKINAGYLTLRWDSGAKEHSMTWDPGYDAVDVGENTKGTAKYKVDGSDETYSTVYTVSVSRAQKINASVSGSISKSVISGKTVGFTASEFSGKYKRNDGNLLNAIKIEDKGSSNDGEFLVSGSSYTLGEPIAYSDMGNISYTAASSGDKKYTVTYIESETDRAVGTVELTITVNNPEIPTVDGGTLTQKETKAFPASQVNAKFKSATSSESDFDRIEFTSLPSSTAGIVYKGYVSSSDKGTAANTGTAYSLSDFLGNGMVFVPASSFTGTAEIKYNVYDDSGEKYAGKVTFTVISSNPADIKATITADETYSISRTDINSKVKAVSGGKDVDYIKFTSLPSSSKGYLYYDGSTKITSTSGEYYYSGTSSSKKYMSKLSFVPSGSTGTATVKYRAYVSGGDYYDGSIIITINEQTSDLSTISYTVDQDGTLDFLLNDFKNVLSKKTSKSLNYVKFELPSSSKGVLYYDYTSSSNYDSKVSSSTKYYASGSGNLLSKVTFVPKSTYSGTFYIKYTAYNSSGTDYSGEIKITVKDTSSDLSEITYQTGKNEDVKFYVSDFTKAIDSRSDNSLNYVYFELPSISYGTLYYDYSSSQSSPVKVGSSTRYYRTGSGKNLIGNITFVPKTDYTGTVTIDYTAYDSEGDKFEGNVVIKVGVSDKLENITYKVGNSKVLAMSSADINTKFRDADGGSFSYVKFTLPSSTYGYLYYDYKSAAETGSYVKSSEKYYRTGTGVSLLSKVSFEPNKNYSGTFDLKYTAYGSDGAEYEGVIRITVTDDGIYTDSSAYFKDVKQDYSWAAGKIDYLYKKGIVKGTDNDSSGMCYSPAANITRGDFILMLYRAFGLSATVTDNFQDVPKDSYYYQAIGVAKALGIAQGAYGMYNPTESLSREDAMVLIDRTIKVTGRKTLTYSSDVSMFGDRSQIASYASASVGTLVKAGVIKGYDDGNFAPKGLLTRAEMAVVLYNVEML
ncbi:MAG: S-layer homology domain-containing protein [Bacillota bacterium]|nr:S-layer homology domain-containing protein [Bacillota bacterium]